MGTVLNFLIRNNRIEEIEQVTNQIDWIGSHASLLLNNTLDWGLSNAYCIDVTPQNIDISLFIKEVHSHYEAAIKTKNIETTFNLPAHLMLTVSPKCIDVIIRNLIGNAKTHTPVGGEIALSIEEIEESKQVAVHIKDTGNGIASEKVAFIQRVFDGKITPEVGENGLGLGIILISNFAKKINSKLSVTSEVGVGSCFTLLIPR
jgi:signal transduction histidine kinase